MHTIADITVDRPSPQSVVVYIKQDDDVIVVYRDEIGDLADALREYSPSPAEEPKPAPEKNVVNGVDLKMSLMFAKATLRHSEMNAAYERGRIAYIESIMED